MTETHISYLYNIATCLQQSENNKSLERLRSVYLMRCTEVTRGHGLPNKLFSSKARCPRCCLEWKNKNIVKIKPRKLSKRQKRKIRSKSESNEKDGNTDLSSVLEQTCSFCHHTTTTTSLKPDKGYPKKVRSNPTNLKMEHIKTKEELIPAVASKSKTVVKNKTIESKKQKPTTNIYTNAFDVFSLNNSKNTLASTVKEPSKIIINSKKKKDKFAGLCQKAVLASAKIKQDIGQDKKQNRLNLFLKPCLEPSTE